MPRSVAGLYTLPPGLPTNGELSDATQDVRTPFQDLEADMNTPRPIVAGGTGAATDVLARKNLGMASFKNLAALLANNTLLYSGTYALVSGDIITTQQEGFSYQVASSTATDHHLTTAGGVKLYVQAPLDFAAFGCTSTADSATAFLAALTAANGQPIRLVGTIRLDTAVSYSGPVNIWSPGDAGRINCANGGTISFVGGLTALPDLSANIVRGGKTVSFVSAHGLALDDVFCVYNPTDYSFSPARPEYRDGDWIKVAIVSSATQITMWGSSPGDYASASMDCYKMNGAGVSVKGVTFTPPASGIALAIAEHKRVDLVVGCDRGADDTGIQVLRCYDVDVEMLPATVVLGNAYPIAIGNSKRVRLDAHRALSDRHCVGFGGSDAVGAVPLRDVIVANCNLVNIVEGVGAADVHGNCDNVMYSNCILESAVLGGRNTTYDGCVVKGRDAAFADGLGFFGSEVGGGVYRIHNCHIVTGGASASFGLIHFTLLNLSNDITIDIRNLTVENYDPTATTTRLIMLVVGTSGVDPAPTKRIDLRVDGVTYVGSSLLDAVRVLGSNDVSALSSISIQNFIAPSCSLVTATAAANLNMPMRLPRQTVKEEVTYTNAEASKVGTAQTFKYVYPRRPLAAVTAHRTDGAAYNPGNTNMAVPYPYDVEAASLRMALESAGTGNFDVGATVTLVGQVWIDEL